MALSGPAKTVVQTVSVVILMGGLAWASVPFYDWFCRVTGFGGTPGQVAGAEGEVLDQTIKVRFDGSLNEDMPWEFKPVVNEMELRIGISLLSGLQRRFEFFFRRRITPNNTSKQQSDQCESHGRPSDSRRPSVYISSK